MFVDVGNPGRRKSIVSLHRKLVQTGKPCPELIIIDARPKKAASTFNDDSWNISLDGLSEFNIDDILIKICQALKVDLSDIMELVEDDSVRE